LTTVSVVDRTDAQLVELARGGDIDAWARAIDDVEDALREAGTEAVAPLLEELRRRLG